jgi:streptogramin lyase
MDAGPDAGVDAGTDAGADAGRDAGMDGGTDAGSDAGIDAGTQLLWLGATSDALIIAYLNGQPTVVLDAGVNAEGIAFDSQGNLWTPDNGHARVVKLAKALLAHSGSPAPTLELDNVDVPFSTLDAPLGLAFDPMGNLWVANCGARSAVVEYAPAQLLQGGAQTPVAMLVDGVNDAGTPLGNVACPYDVAFDGVGGLWWVNQGSLSVGYLSTPQLESGVVEVTPNQLLALPALTSHGAQGLVIDGMGAVWVAASLDGTIARYFGGLTVSQAELPGAAGLAFDATGSLWVSTQQGTMVQVLDPLSQTGTFTPAIGASVPIPRVDSGKPAFSRQ